MRWCLENDDKRILVIVPTTSLVEQMYADFESYGYNVEENCHKIYSGKDKKTDKRIVITTWQSIFKLNTKWFSKFGCIFGDEVHGFKAKSLSSIMNKSIQSEYRFGTTGTLDGTQVHKLVLEGLFGRMHKVITTHQLQENKTLAKLNIDIILLQYKEEFRKEQRQGAIRMKSIFLSLMRKEISLSQTWQFIKQETLLFYLTWWIVMAKSCGI